MGEKFRVLGGEVYVQEIYNPESLGELPSP
jgi:hypothetical protein